jgi:hypothetical protein
MTKPKPKERWRTRRPDPNRTPPLANGTHWAAVSIELARFISTPRTWLELELWAKETKTSGDAMRNQLAYLEYAGRAYTTVTRAGLVWVGQKGDSAMTTSWSTAMTTLLASMEGELERVTEAGDALADLVDKVGDPRKDAPLVERWRKVTAETEGVGVLDRATAGASFIAASMVRVDGNAKPLWFVGPSGGTMRPLKSPRHVRREE